MKTFDEIFGKSDVKSKQLPSSIVAEEFGEINMRQVNNELQIIFTILWKPALEGCRTGIAIDGSASMRDAYGLTCEWSVGKQEIAKIEKEYKQQNKLKEMNVDGVKYSSYTPQAIQELIANNYMKMKENMVNNLAQDFVSHLAEGLDYEGKTTVIYWSCGDGSQIEILGDISAEEAKKTSYVGPKKKEFGSKTYLIPPVKYFDERFQKAKFGMFIIITDGKVEDLEAVKEYTVSLAQNIENNKRNPLKFVLIGVGSEVDQQQMEELDDLETGTSIDIWDHKIAKEMRNLNDIFAEIVSENQLVADSGIIYDSQGNIVKRLADGVPAIISFSMPVSSSFFELEVYGKRIQQKVIF